MEYVWLLLVYILLILYIDHCTNINLCFTVLSSMLWSYMGEWKSTFNFLNLSAWRSWVANFMPWPLYSLGNFPQWIWGWVRSQPVWMLWRRERCHSKLGVEPEFCDNLSHSLIYVLTELPCDYLLKDLCLPMWTHTHRKISVEVNIVYLGNKDITAFLRQAA